jgi:hypothetical protein
MSLGIDGLFAGSETIFWPSTLDDYGQKLFFWRLWMREKGWLWVYWSGDMVTSMERSFIETLMREFCKLKSKNAKTSERQPFFLCPVM